MWLVSLLSFPYSVTDPTRKSEETPSSNRKPITSQDHTKRENVHRDGNTNTTTHNARTRRPTGSLGNRTAGPPDELEEGSSTTGIVPALIVLSVLAVPVVFLLFTSIVLRLRAYRRDKYDKFNRFRGNSSEGLGVSHSRGWLSYMNCCDKRKYRFNRVTLQDFYSDSESEGV